MVDPKLERLFDEEWGKVNDDFNHPQVAVPRLVPAIPGMDTARFDFISRTTEVSEGYVRLMERNGLDPRTAISGLLRHEMGHYAFFPRDAADALALRTHADLVFREKGEPIYTLFGEAVDDLTTMQRGLGAGIMEERRAMLRADRSRDPQGAGLWDLFLGVYERVLSLGAGDVPLEYTSAAEKLANVNYFDPAPAERRLAIVQFGNAIKDHLPNRVRTVDGCSLSLDHLTQQQIDQALAQIIIRYGKASYKAAKQWLKAHKPDYKDPLDTPLNPNKKGIGLAGSELQFHDEEVPFYVRWASTFPVYIARRPLVADATDPEKAGLRDFEVGDPIQAIDVFGSRGQIGMPGVSKVRTTEPSPAVARKKLVPDLSCWVDSSGSMEHPRAKAVQILAAHLLGTNYHANGSLVGGANFSADLAYLPPTRDLAAYRSLMTAYWGGGTVLNTEKLRQWLVENKKGLQVDSIEDRDLLSHIDPRKRREFEEKNLQVRLDRARRERLERLDGVIISDGYIANGEEVIDFLHALAEHARVYAFITSEAGYQQWLPHASPRRNVFVYKAVSPRDLIGLSLGLAKAIPQHARELGRYA